MQIHNPTNKKPISNLWAFLSVDENGNEGICGARVADGEWFALVTAEQEMLPMLKELAKIACYGSKKQVQLVKFGTRENVEIIS